MDYNIKIHDDSNKPVRTAFVVNQNRVQHYADVVAHMTNIEIARCKAEENFTPSQSQIKFLQKELTRFLIIRRDIEGAQKIRIRKNTILNEDAHVHNP